MSYRQQQENEEQEMRERHQALREELKRIIKEMKDAKMPLGEIISECKEGIYSGPK